MCFFFWKRFFFSASTIDISTQILVFSFDVPWEFSEVELFFFSFQFWSCSQMLTSKSQMNPYKALLNSLTWRHQERNNEDKSYLLAPGRTIFPLRRLPFQCFIPRVSNLHKNPFRDWSNWFPYLQFNCVCPIRHEYCS